MPQIMALTPDQAIWIEEHHRHVSWRVRATDWILRALHSLFPSKDQTAYKSPIIFGDEDDGEGEAKSSEECARTRIDEAEAKRTASEKQFEEAFAQFGQGGRRVGNITK